MIQQIAVWGGIAGLIVSVFAVIILYLTRQNILDILDKDVILFDKNFEMKKQALEKAMSMIDEISKKGNQILFASENQQKALALYNELLCVVSDIRVADEFYSITMDTTEIVDETRLAQFKLKLRQDLGLKTKHSKAIKRTINKTPKAPVSINNIQSDKPSGGIKFENANPYISNQPPKSINTNANQTYTNPSMRQNQTMPTQINSTRPPIQPTKPQMPTRPTNPKE